MSAAEFDSEIFGSLFGSSVGRFSGSIPSEIRFAFAFLMIRLSNDVRNYPFSFTLDLRVERLPD